jgi:protein SPT2
MALLREEEEEMMPHKRKRKVKEEKVKEIESIDKSHSQSDYRETKECEEEKPEKSVKSRRPPPFPTMDFSELLKIAEKKQFEPIKITPKVKEEEGDERPMTKKQRAEYMKEQEWRMRKEGKLPPLTAPKQVSRNSQPQALEERSRDQKSSHLAADSSSDHRNNGPSADGNRDQRISQRSVDGQRERMGSLPSGYGNKYQVSGRLSDQRISQPSSDISRDHGNSRPLKGNRDQKSSRSSEDGNSSISRILNMNTSSRVAKDEKSQHRIPKLNGSSSISSSSNKSVKLQGNSASKVGKERSRDEVRNSNMSGKPPFKNNHTSSSSASGHGCLNTNSVEQKRKDTRSCNNNSGNNSKNYNLSSYSKKLQESLLAKLQEKERSGELSEANKFRVPEAPNSRLPKNRDSGSFDINRGSKPQSKLARSSDLKDISLRKNSAKPFASSQRINEIHHGTLSSESQESSLRSKFGHEIPSKDVKDRKPSQMLSKDVRHRQFPPPEVKPRQFPPSDVKSRQFPSPDVKPRQFPPADVKPRQFPPADVKPRQFPPADVRPRQFPPANVKPRQIPPADVRTKPKLPPKREYNL